MSLKIASFAAALAILTTASVIADAQPVVRSPVTGDAVAPPPPRRKRIPASTVVKADKQGPRIQNGNPPDLAAAAGGAR